MVVDFTVADQRPAARGAEGLPSAVEVHDGKPPVAEPGVPSDNPVTTVVRTAVSDALKHRLTHGGSVAEPYPGLFAVYGGNPTHDDEPSSPGQAHPSTAPYDGAPLG